MIRLTVDNNELDIKIRTLTALAASIRVELRKVENTKESLQQIRVKNGAVPVDSGTGRQMSDARRQEIWDVCAAVADNLIAQYPKYPPDLPPESDQPPGP